MNFSKRKTMKTAKTSKIKSKLGLTAGQIESLNANLRAYKPKKGGKRASR